MADLSGIVKELKKEWGPSREAVDGIERGGRSSTTTSVARNIPSTRTSEPAVSQGYGVLESDDEWPCTSSASAFSQSSTAWP
jgi:hypothetical protein